MTKHRFTVVFDVEGLSDEEAKSLAAIASSSIVSDADLGLGAVTVALERVEEPDPLETDKPRRILHAG